MNTNLEQQLQIPNLLYKESDHIYSSLASELGMTGTTFLVLYAVAHPEDPMTQNDLCNDFFFSVQTINSYNKSCLSKTFLLFFLSNKYSKENISFAVWVFKFLFYAILIFTKFYYKSTTF